MSRYINEDLLEEDVLKLGLKQAEEELEELGAKIMILGDKLSKDFNYDTVIRFAETQLKIAAIVKYSSEVDGGTYE